jgi:hypothetical protein
MVSFMLSDLQHLANILSGRVTFFIGKDGIVKDVCDSMIDWK